MRRLRPSSPRGASPCPAGHASGFIALVAPLVEEGLLAADAPLACTSLTGYSGGGKKMIADYAEKGAAYDPPRAYGLAQAHKHLPEMQNALSQSPVFLPVVGNFYSGMLVSVPLHRSMLRGGAGIEDVRAVYRARYTGPVVSYREAVSEGGFLSAGRLSGRDGMWIACEGGGRPLYPAGRLRQPRQGRIGRGSSALEPEDGRGSDLGPETVIKPPGVFGLRL